MFVLWREAMSIDGGLIDRDHQALIAIINEFAAFSPDPSAADGLMRVLLNLDAYARKHFSREDALQKAIRYPYRDAHHVEHGRLITELTRVRSEFAAVKGVELVAMHERMKVFL